MLLKSISILLLGILFFQQAVDAQNLTGDWNGYLTQNNKTWAYVLNMKIMQSGNSLRGFARVTTNTGAYARHEFNGLVEGNKVTIKETRVVEDGGKGLVSWCIKILNGELSITADKYTIEGNWVNDGNRSFQNGIVGTGPVDCPPGRFKITRPYSCTEASSSLLLAMVEEWREKKPYETTQDWLQRTSSRNTEIQYRKVLQELQPDLLNESDISLAYNAETELFTIRSTCFGSFQLRVPQTEADCFEKNFRKDMLRNLVFDYHSDSKLIVVDSIRVQHPCNQLTYAFPLPAPIPGISAPDSMAVVEANPLLKREITIVNELDVRSKTVEVRFYDNGTVDGDIISIYFNGVLIQERQALTSSPIRFTLQLREDGDNIIAMYAENLGSIPPNTALMLVDDGGSIIRIPLESNLQRSGAVKIRVKREF